MSTDMFQSCLIAVFAQSVANQNNQWQAYFLVTLVRFEYQMMIVQQKQKNLKIHKLNLLVTEMMFLSLNLTRVNDARNILQSL